MKASELRIGNLVYKEWVETDRGDYQTEHEITGHDLEHLDVDGCFYQEGEASPIPLSEEWLLKFGFKERGCIKFIGYAYPRYVLGRNSLYTLDKKAYIFEVNEHDLCEIKYVHQLQNLYFALTGNELTIQP